MTVTPTSFDSAFGDLAREMIAESGRSLLLRQPTRVESQSGASAGSVVTSPLSSSSLTVDGAHIAGVSVVDLNAVGVTGLLVAGDVLTIDGAEYTVTGGPYSVTANAIANVGISPALAADAGDEDAVTVDFAGTFTAVKGVVSSVSHRWIASGVAKIGDLQVMLSRVALQAAGVTLAVGDELHLGATAAAPLYAIEAVLPLASGELDAAYTVIARAR